MNPIALLNEDALGLLYKSTKSKLQHNTVFKMTLLFLPFHGALVELLSAKRLNSYTFVSEHSTVGHPQ